MSQKKINFPTGSTLAGSPSSATSSGLGAMNKGYSDSELEGGKGTVSGAADGAPLSGNESGYSGSSVSTVFTIFPVQEPGNDSNHRPPALRKETSMI